MDNNETANEQPCQAADAIMQQLLMEWGRLKRLEMEFNRLKSMGACEAAATIPSVDEYIGNLEKRNKRLNDCLSQMLPDYKAEIRRSHILSGKPSITVDFSQSPIIIEAESLLTP